uniref:TRPM SLOG domain-containing protein n=1 Tax=Ursus maritimus TaxID=29073 RepID=A0A452TJC7_URSMA
RRGPWGRLLLVAPRAWILTSALCVGLARYVGQAVRDHSLASTSARARVVAIGLASLGRVLHRQLLDNCVCLRPWEHVCVPLCPCA